MKLLTIGDNGALIYPEAGMMYPAGNAVAVAAYSSKLDNGSDYLGVFGGDGYGRFVKDSLVSLGIGLSQCRFSALPSTRWMADGAELPENDYELSIEMPLALNNLDLTYMEGFDGIHVCASARIDHRLPEIMKTGAVIAYDFAEMWRWDALKAVCPNVHIAYFSLSKLSDYEAKRFLLSVCNLGCYLAVGLPDERGVKLATKRGLQEIPPNALPADGDFHGANAAFMAGFFTAFCQMAHFRSRTLKVAPDFLLGKDDELRFEDMGYASCAAAGQYLAARACALPGLFDKGVPAR